MGVEITPQFVMQYERDMRAISEQEYARRVLAEDFWAPKVLRTKNIARRSERVTWILSTASIEPMGPSGTGRVAFEDLVTQTVEYPVLRHGKGLKVQRDQIEDLDGTGLNMLAEWSSQIGSEMAYYKQRLGSQLILNGAATDGTANAYDAVPFFTDTTDPHLNNPFYSGAANQQTAYANWLHSSASSQGTSSTFAAYPGACPIDDSVSLETAVINFSKVLAYIASLKMPNNIDPRFLKVAYLMVPPRLAPRARQLLKAKFAAQVASSGAGTGDIGPITEGWALAETIVAQEFASSTTYNNVQVAVANPTTGALTMQQPTTAPAGSDSTYYVVTQSMSTTQLGGLLHVERKPFKVSYYTGDSGGGVDTAALDRANEFEYHCQGRSSVQYGHPYSMFRVDAS